VKIVQLMEVRSDERDKDWLRKALQAAIELEFATIPPYLCALWSIKDDRGPVYDRVLNIVLEEMLHMGLACNMLTALDGTPRISDPRAVPKYPGPLPGGVRPELKVPLSGLTKDLVERVFMQIEYPRDGPVALFRGETYPTVGAFYDAILAAFRKIPGSEISAARQLTSGGLYRLRSLADVEKAINQIKEQGEGTSQSPLAEDFGGELAHYYRFAEIVNGRELVKRTDGKWKYEGREIPFPEVFPMAEVPKGGYAESKDFDRKYSAMLGKLQRAWEKGHEGQLRSAMEDMRTLGTLARELIKRPLPSGNGTYGPSFLFCRPKVFRKGGRGMAMADSDPRSGPEGFVKVGLKKDFPIKTVARITVNQEARALSHVDPTANGVDPSCPFYATQLVCTHVTSCELDRTGVLDGKVVTCKTKYKPGCAHGSKFDVTTGEVKNGPADQPLVTYETRCVNEEIWVAIEPRAMREGSST